MKARRLPLLLLFGLLSLGAVAQDSNPSQDAGQPGPGRGPGQRGRFGGNMMGAGRGVVGTVTETTSDHFTVKTDSGEVYTVHYSANTRIMKGGGGARRSQGETDGPMTPPQSIKASDIKLGDAIAASGEVDASAKSVGAVVIFQIDPERAKQLREMQANYGKTWLMGRVTAINDVKVTLDDGPDHTPHTFVADENTTFRKRRDPITLGDIQVGDMVRVEGVVKGSSFLAASVVVMGPPARHPDQGNGAPSASPPQ